MKVLGIIPARGGSKGVPRKNIKFLGDKPLIAHSILSAKNSNLTDVIVSTEDEEIAMCAADWGLKPLFLRPDELATDNAKSIEVAIHALLEFEGLTNQVFDAIMLLQPTTPFRSSVDINNALILLNNDMESDSVISVVDVGGNHPARMKYIKNGYLIDPPFCEIQENQNRQELEPMYIRNGAIYLTKRQVILNKSFKGSKSLALVMEKDRSINIDTISDFEYAEWCYKKK